MKIDFVAPPFAGHLFPQLQLAQYAKSQGIDRLRFFSCPKMKAAVKRAGIEFLPLLADHEAEVLDIVLGHSKQMSNSIRENLKVVNRTLNLMHQFSHELRTYWQADRPDLIVVDYVSPLAGVVADELGIPWWTALESPTVIEAKKGTPPFLGGWEPPKTILGKCRDACGRTFIRLFKKMVFALYRKKIQSLGIKSIYREDGSERIFSNDVILALGIPEFEFENEWSPAMRWIGPCTESPVFDVPSPHYESGRKHIFVSLGTQIPWAKERAQKVFREVAGLLPEIVFHFTLGNTDMKEPQIEDNLHFYGYIPYTPDAFRHYDVIVNHGGIGVLYTAMMAGVPQLIWAQDHDQHDNAARIAHHGLGLRSRGKPQSIVAEIKKLLENDSYRKRAEEYQQIVNRCHPGRSFVELLQKKFSE
jgi:UDP:flavonoid glycosyltransferase YjiC (YdhE family)